MQSLILKLFLTSILVICSSFIFSQENSKSFIIVKEVRVIGNKTTQENIIVREIPININDTILFEDLSMVLERTKSNLINTSLFNFVTVEPVYFDDNNISLYITVEERWYWWPIPIFQVEETNFNTWLEDKDFNKVSYGLFLAKENFRGRKEQVMLLLQTGYSEKIGLKYIVPFINKKKTSGLSFKFTYGRNHEVFYSVTNNKRDYYRSNNDYVQKEINTSFGYEWRPKLYYKHNFEIGYNNVNVTDSILFYNPQFLSGTKNDLQYFNLAYKVRRDKRDNKNYPTKGSYYDLGFNKSGFGVLDDDLNSSFVTAHLKKFWKLAPKFYLSSSLKLKYTLQDAPFYLMRGLGQGNDLVRGYELYVVNGEHFGVFKSQLRYGLLEGKTFNVKALRANKFNKIPLSIYLGTYFDAGYVDSKRVSTFGFLENKTMFGGGISLDFVSYYDMVIRTEFSINRFNEKGVFLHFIAPI
jgi:outer membrane protein assembly factor BamA